MKGQVYLELFLSFFFFFFYQKESHTGYLLLVVLKQNIYSLTVWLVLHIGEVMASKQVSQSSPPLQTPGGHLRKDPAAVPPTARISR